MVRSRELFSGCCWFRIIDSTPLWMKNDSASTPVKETKLVLNLFQQRGKEA